LNNDQKREATMAVSMRPKGINHPNLVLRDGDASIERFRELYGAEFMMEVPTTTCRAVLVEIGRVIIELFTPNEFLLNARHGAHLLGLEYWVDIDEAREALASHGVRLVSDHGHMLHTDPADGFGVSFELYGRYFYDADTPIPTPLKPVEYWRDEHPLGLLGLKGYTVAVGDADAASRFYQSLFSGEPMYDEARPELGARAVGLKVADSLVELLAPVGDGPLRQELYRTGQGVRSFVLQTADLGRARRHFSGRDVALVPGSAPDRFGVAPDASRGVLFEFSE
jgi:catechol 2,3-dioxygenase-like lactoylglutathione lyase family enzyme